MQDLRIYSLGDLPIKSGFSSKVSDPLKEDIAVKKIVCILTLCICLILAGCALNVPPADGNTPDLNKQVVYNFDPEKELNVIYSIFSYDQLLPRVFLDGYVLCGYDLQNYADLSMNKQRSVNLSFRNEHGIDFPLVLENLKKIRFPVPILQTLTILKPMM